MLNNLMTTENKDKTCQECDDPCDDCTDIEMGNLTAWITPQPADKKVDNEDQT